MYILGGAPIVAPTATVALYQRVVYSTPGRFRIVGVLVLVLVAAPLIVTARMAPVERGVTNGLEALGWLAAAAMVWVIATPEPGQRLANWFWDAVSDDPAVLRVIGMFNVALGLFLGWVAFVAL